MNKIKIILPIKPVAQMRARHTAQGGFVRTYKAPEQAKAEQSLIACLLPLRPPEPLQGPLRLGVRAYLPIPRCKSGKWKAAAAAGEIRPIVKPDLDNLLKHIEDCLTVAGFWHDDRQVVEYLPGTGKYYSTIPRWEIEIMQLDLSSCEVKKWEKEAH